VVRLHLALEKCNADKQAVTDILTSPVREKKADEPDVIQKRHWIE
jgi:hypothetical protein